MKDNKEIVSKILEVILEQLNDEDSEYYIDIQNVDVTDYFHALSNQIPCMMYKRLTGKDVNLLEFNHIANDLCFQFMKHVE